MVKLYKTIFNLIIIGGLSYIINKKSRLTIFLLVFFLLVSSVNGKIIEKKAVNKIRILNDNELNYVDDDNIQGPWNGSIDYPFRNIQDAVNATDSGGSIFVFNGTYYEHIVIEKTLTLLGEDKNNTIIDGGGIGSVIYITANWTNISGFTIQNCGELTDFFYAGIVLSRSNNNSIFNNRIIKNKGESIYLRINSTNNRIFLNDISDNTEGIRLNVYCSNNKIYKNIISNITYFGIVLSYESNNNKIFKNKIIGNATDHYHGIRFFLTNYNEVYENIIIAGLWGTAFSLEHSDKNLIMKNNFIGNNGFPDEGIIIDYKCHKNKIYKNNFLNHSIHATFDTSFFNHWDRNYWDDWIGLKYRFGKILPKKIKGKLLFIIPMYNFDFHPAKKPYDIQI
jgi:parallel beta-helix repeat protein